MATIQLRQVSKKFGDTYAVRPFDMTIQNGEFVVLLGPSGCGKTTTLRMISGLEAVTGGQILIDGRDVTWNHPSDRDIAFVFQFFALYPHMSVRENIAFTLEAQKAPKAEIDRRVAEVAQLLQIGHLLKLRPKSLSGGDRQRVALARALVRRPAAFLMDEPLGALDADFRSNMRAEIKRLHMAQRATTVYVTHDQIEAMAMGDRIVVMSNATVQQIGTPGEVYYDPANLFVARFIGSPGMNLLRGTYTDGIVTLPGDNPYAVPEPWRPILDKQVAGEQVVLGFRPEGAALTPNGPLQAQVFAEDLHGAYAMVHLALAGEEPDSSSPDVLAGAGATSGAARSGVGDPIVHVRAGRDVQTPIGSLLRFDLKPELVRFFDARSEAALPRPVMIPAVPSPAVEATHG
jgi:multiple sugar transport system ATP-binding protein